MRKYVTLFFIFFSLNAFSWEIDSKLSYKVYSEDYKKFSISVDGIFFNKGMFEIGLGTSYEYPYKFIPLYLVNKIDLYRSKDNIKEFNLYIIDRFGLGIDSRKLSIDYSLGLGFHYREFLIELSYDGAYLPSIKKYKNELSLSLGIRLGDFIQQKKKYLVEKEDIDFKK